MKMPDARTESGFSLPTVIALGMVAAIWMLGTAAIVMPSAGRVTIERARDISRASAEAALDWAVQRMNNPDTRSMIDLKSNVAVPSAVLADGAHYTGTVSVMSVAPPTSSYLYDPNIDPTQPASNIADGNGWRAVTATVHPNGIAFGGARTVRVIMKPTYAVSFEDSNQVEVYEGDPVSMFVRAAFAKLSVGGMGNLVTNSYDSAKTINPITYEKKYADIGTNQAAALKGNSNIGGDLSVTAPKGTPSVVASGADNAKVEGKIRANGDVSGFTSQAADSVLKFEKNDQVTLPPVPPAPPDAADLGANLNISGTSVVRLSATQARLPNGTVIPNTKGNYIANSISLAQSARIMVDASGGPISVYVQGTGSSNGISLTGNGVSNTGLPSSFRIWYGGTGDTRLQGNGIFRGVIYAPNSNLIQVQNAEVYGALVANKLTFDGNAIIHYDTALSRAQEFMYRPLKTRDISGSTSTRKIKSFQVVSWDEW